MKRTHTCGELTDKGLGKTVKLCGWVNSRRDHGGIIFIDLRDRYGLTQVVFDPNRTKDAHKEAEGLHREDVIQVEGVVERRKPGMENPKLVTGQIEVFVKTLDILSHAETPPIEIDDRVVANDEVRLEYRYLDLRRPIMQERLMVRHKAAQAARSYLSSHGFLEIETPLLVRATPEGARDYIVPSRVNPGKFYALPQSPQLYKQISMVAGCDRYFQLARCLRDEDLRADRQPEHTQIDIEMSFIEQEDIQGIVEGLIQRIFKEAGGVDVKIPFPKMSYQEAMERYGSDKPDIRFGLELIDVTSVVKKSDFKVFKEAPLVKCICVERSFSRNEIDELTALAIKNGAKGLAWMKYDGAKLESSVVKFFSEAVQKELLSVVKPKKESLILFVADRPKVVANVLKELRLELGRRLKLYDEKEFNFLWIVDFPLFEFDEDQDLWMPAHHMFTMPKAEHLQYLESDPGKVHGQLYDLTLNGIELASGSIRIHRSDIQERVMKVIGLSHDEATRKFGFLLKAFRYGAPPHGGIGIGFDRTVALMQGLTDIREVIAYPKNKAAECPMDGCPSTVDPGQLADLHIKIDEISLSKENLVLPKITGLLDSHKMEYKTFQHASVFTSEEAAKVRGTELREGTKALVLKKDGHQFMMACVPGDREIDLPKLQRAVGAKTLDLARADEVKRATGCQIGAVPPFGNLFNLEVFIDKRIATNEFMAFNAGNHKNSIRMKVADFKELVKPRIEEFGR